MVSELEKRFFNTFGIEKIIPCYKCNMQNTNWDCKRICLYDDEKRKEYPQITDRILLELICIISCELSDKLNIKTLKKRIIQDSIYCYNDNSNEKFKQKVQALFKEVI